MDGAIIFMKNTGGLILRSVWMIIFYSWMMLAMKESRNVLLSQVFAK